MRWQLTRRREEEAADVEENKEEEEIADEEDIRIEGKEKIIGVTATHTTKTLWLFVDLRLYSLMHYDRRSFITLLKIIMATYII